MASTTPPPAGDGYPDGLDEFDRPGEPNGRDDAPGATEDAAPAWGEQLQASYEQGDSGGWGAPHQYDTGPLRLGLGAHDDNASADGPGDPPDDFGAPQPPPAPGPGSSARGPYEQTREQTPYAQGTYPQGSYEHAGYGQGPGQRAYEQPQGPGAFEESYDHGGYPPPPQGYPQSGPMPVAPPPSLEGFRAGTYNPGNPGNPGTYNPGSYSPGAYGPTPPRKSGRRDGLAAMFDFTFARKATHAIAPVLFWLVVAWGVFQVLYVLVSLAGAGSFGPGAGATFLGVVAAIFDALLKIALARVFLELAINVADMAERAQSGTAAR
ncbi:MAG: DUF4282 domain-containing protein [Dermatophilaceae bacterium]